MAKRILPGSAEKNVRWFFREAAGDFGMHAQNLEPQIGHGVPDYDPSEHALDSVVRYREIESNLRRITPDQRQVLALAYGSPRHWAPYSEFGELLAPLVEHTDAARRRACTTLAKRPHREETIRVDAADVRSAIEGALRSKTRDVVFIKRARVEAETMLAEACGAYVRSERKDELEWVAQ